MTCGVRWLLSLLLGLGILLNTPESGGCRGVGDPTTTLNKPALRLWNFDVAHCPWWKNNKETFFFTVRRQTVWAAFMFQYHINNA